MSHQVESLPVSLDVGSLYRFRGIEGVPRDGKTVWVYGPGTYRLIAVGKNYRTDQEMAVYVGVGGWDDGNTYLACLGDWVRDFSKVEPPAVAEPVPDRVPMQTWTGTPAPQAAGKVFDVTSRGRY